VGQWLDRHERFTFHFTPTYCSWLNAVEGFFAKLTKRRLKRGVFRLVTDLQAAINRFLEEHNGEAKRFTWTADPEKIIAASQARAPSVRFNPLVPYLAERALLELAQPHSVSADALSEHQEADRRAQALMKTLANRGRPHMTITSNRLSQCKIAVGSLR
jgi:DDE superfamily endonuclease